MLRLNEELKVTKKRIFRAQAKGNTSSNFHDLASPSSKVQRDFSTTDGTDAHRFFLGHAEPSATANFCVTFIIFRGKRTICVLAFEIAYHLRTQKFGESLFLTVFLQQ